MRYSGNIERLQPSATIAVSTLAKRLAAEGRDILNLSAGEPDFDTPVFIADAAVEGIRAGQTRYTPPPGIPSLRRVIADRLSERAGRALDPAAGPGPFDRGSRSWASASSGSSDRTWRPSPSPSRTPFPWGNP